jgi:acyl carrier protein
LPLTPNGKVDRRALPAPDWARPELERGFVAPHTPMEALIAAIWREVLGVDRVGVYDNFFDLGGHSLLAMQVVARLEEALALRINPRELMLQTLGQLASSCEERKHAKPSERISFVQKLRNVAKRALVSSRTEKGPGGSDSRDDQRGAREHPIST